MVRDVGGLVGLGPRSCAREPRDAGFLVGLVRLGARDHARAGARNGDGAFSLGARRLSRHDILRAWGGERGRWPFLTTASSPSPRCKKSSAVGVKRQLGLQQEALQCPAHQDDVWIRQHLNPIQVVHCWKQLPLSPQVRLRWLQELLPALQRKALRILRPIHAHHHTGGSDEGTHSLMKQWRYLTTYQEEYFLAARANKALGKNLAKILNCRNSKT